MFLISALNKDQLENFNKHQEDAKAFVRTFPLRSWDNEEKDSLAYDALYYAAEHFNPDKGMSFKSFLYQVVSSKYKSLFVKEKKKKEKEVSIETPVRGPKGEDIALKDILEDISDVRKSDYLKYLTIDEALHQSLNDKELLILRKASEGYTMAEIAPEIGVTEARISTIIKGIRDKLEGLLEDLG